MTTPLPTGDALRRRTPPTPFDHHPLLAIWEITQACDLACAHCRACATSFAESLRILEAARDLGIETQVNTSVGPHNHKALAATAALVEGVGVVLWSVFMVVPTGRAGASLLLGPKAVERILEQLADIATTSRFDVKTTAAPHFRRVMLERHAKRGAVGVLHDPLTGPGGQKR